MQPAKFAALPQAVERRPDLSILATALDEVLLTRQLSNPSLTYTLFAPTGEPGAAVWASDGGVLDVGPTTYGMREASRCSVLGPTPCSAQSGVGDPAARTWVGHAAGPRHVSGCNPRNVSP